MNKKYLEALNEIVNLATDAILEDQDAFAATAFMLIIDKIIAANGVREIPLPSGTFVPAKVIPHDEPAAEVPRTQTQEEYFKEYYSLINGEFPIRRGNSEQCVVESVWVGKRRFTMEVVVTDKTDGVTTECEFTVRDNGRIKISGRYYGGKAMAEKVAHKALKAHIKNLSGGNTFSGRGGFLKQALKRLMEQRGKDSAAPVKEEANQA